MKISARNILKGKVKNIKTGAINNEVTIELVGGTEIVSVITKESTEELQLTNGSSIYAIIKASNVIIGTD